MEKRKKARTPEATREALLKSAKKLFAKQGYDGTSVQDLVADAGVNVSLVSYHFGGKAGLYQACLDQYGQSKLASAANLLGAAETTDELRTRLSLFIDEMVRSYIEEPEIVRMLHRDIELDNPISRNIFRTRFIKIFELLVNLLSDSQKKGLIRTDLDPETTAALFNGMFVHMIRSDCLVQRYFGKSLKDATYRNQMRDAILSIFFEGTVKTHA